MNISWYLILIFFSTGQASPYKDALRGKHLSIVPLELPTYLMITRNATGHVTNMDGISYRFLDWLSQYYDFQWTMIDDHPKSFEGSSKVRGSKSYILSGEADFVVSALLMSWERFQEVDFGFPCTQTLYNLLIPFPEDSVNMQAPWQPFQHDVWMLIIASAVATIIALVFVSWWIKGADYFENYFRPIQASSTYVVAVIFSQGGVCYPKRFTVRLVAACWCIGTFVFVNIYNTTLISFVTSPRWQLMVNSLYELPNVPKGRVVVDEGLSPDVIFSTAKSGAFKIFGDMLARDPSLRCNRTEQCLQRVKSGPFAYIHSANIVLFHINEDLKKNKKCSFTRAKDGFLYSIGSFAFPKNSPYIQAMNQGIIALRDTGLPVLWERLFTPYPRRCLEFNQKNRKKPRLSVKKLSSAFVLLISGHALALFIFAMERIWKRIHLG